MFKYFSSEKQGTKGEDCGHLDDREQQLVGFHDAFSFLQDSLLPFPMFIFPFKDGNQSGGNHEHHSPKEQEICSSRTEKYTFFNYSQTIIV